MEKRDYIIKLLNSLEWKRAMVKWLKIIIEWNLLKGADIDFLMDVFTRSINETNDLNIKSKFKKSQKFLEKLKDIEFENKEKDNEEIQELDQLLQNI